MGLEDAVGETAFLFSDERLAQRVVHQEMGDLLKGVDVGHVV